MLNSKQRAQLRAMSTSLDTIFQVGKNGINDESLRVVDAALEARELIKCKTLETSPVTPREAADVFSKELGADVVMVIGTKFVLYRESKTAKKNQS